MPLTTIGDLRKYIENMPDDALIISGNSWMDDFTVDIGGMLTGFCKPVSEEQYEFCEDDKEGYGKAIAEKDLKYKPCLLIYCGCPLIRIE